MTSQEKLNLVTNYFAEDWAIKKALSLLEDYENAQQPSPSASVGALLRKMEWEEVRHEYRDSQYFCPVCDADKRDGHAVACEMAAVLRAIDEQSSPTPQADSVLEGKK